MLNNLNQLDQANLKGHIFIGTVVSVDDPDQIERIKVHIPNVFDNPDPQLLPWVGRRDGGPIANKGSDYGSFGLVPGVGSKVFVEFQGGNPDFPLYWKSPKQKGGSPAEALVNYPNRYGWKDPAGNVIYIDTTPSQVTLKVTHVSGTVVTIDNSGKMSVEGVDTLEMEFVGNASIKAGGNMNLEADGNVVIKGARIDLNP